MAVGRVVMVPLLVLVPLSGCVEGEDEDEGPQCSSSPGNVHSIVIRDEQDPRGDIARLDVQVAASRSGIPLVHQFAVTPWAGETVFRFPYRLNPIITDPGDVAVAVAARSTALDLVSSGTLMLSSGAAPDCRIGETFSNVEID